MIRPKRRKIFYVPGMISLLIVPFMFIEYANQELTCKPLYSLRINIADKSWLRKYPQLLTEFKGSIPPKRNYVDIIFDGDNTDNRIKLNFAQVRIREIIAENDSINGVRFHFTNSSEWWTFVESLNILHKEQAERFVPLDDDIWFFNIPANKEARVRDYI